MRRRDFEKTISHPVTVSMLLYCYFDIEYKNITKLISKPMMGIYSILYFNLVLLDFIL